MCYFAWKLRLVSNILWINAALKKGFLREPLPFLKTNNIAIERENVTKILDVRIDENLSRNQHINYFSTKMSKSISKLYKSKGIVKQPLLKQLHFSFIYLHLNYGNITWANTYKSKLEGLHRHQKHAAHEISFKINLPMLNHYFMTWKP